MNGKSRVYLTAMSMIDDPVRSVRNEAARLVIGTPLATLGQSERDAARRAVAAYQNSLFARADFQETQMQIAGLAMTIRNFRAAQSALREALSMDPQLADAWLTLARIQSALRRPAEAKATLETATRKVPGNAVDPNRSGWR